MKLMRSLVVVAAIGAVTSPAIAQDEGGMAGEHSAQVQEVMEKYATPGPQHQIFEPLVGTFDYESRFWMMPGADPMVDEGTTEYTWKHGGRYLMQKVDGTAMGQPFAGTGLFGYDRFRGEHFSYWWDNMTTSVMEARGSANEAGNKIMYEGTNDNIWEGKKDQWSRSVLSIEGNDNHSWASYVKGPDGKEFKNFEIVYTRSKMAAK